MNVKKQNNITFEFSGVEDVEKRIFIRNGDFNGIYDFSQKKAVTGKFLDDKKEGTWLKWYENGKIQFEHNYFSGQLHGKFKHSWDNGKIALKGEYVFGKEHGKFEYFDRKGKKIKETDNDYGKILNYRNDEEDYSFDFTDKDNKKSSKEIKPALICSVWSDDLIDCRTRTEYFNIISDVLSPEDLIRTIDLLNFKYDELRDQLDFLDKDGILGLCPGNSFSATASEKGRGFLGLGRDYNRSMGNVQLTIDEITSLTNKCSANSIDSIASDSRDQNGVGGGGYFNDGNFQSGEQTIETIRQRREDGLPLGEFGDFVEEAIDRIESGLENCVDSGSSPIATGTTTETYLKLAATAPNPYIAIGIASISALGTLANVLGAYYRDYRDRKDPTQEDLGDFFSVTQENSDGSKTIKVIEKKSSRTISEAVVKGRVVTATEYPEGEEPIVTTFVASGNEMVLDDPGNTCAGKRLGWEITKKLCEGRWDSPDCLNTLDEFNLCSDPTLVRYIGGGVKCKSPKTRTIKEAMEKHCQDLDMITIREEGYICMGPNQVTPNPFGEPCSPLTKPDPESGCFGVDISGSKPRFPKGGGPSPIQMYHANNFVQPNNIRLISEEDEFIQLKNSNEAKLVVFHSTECPPCHSLLNNLSNLKEKEEKYNGLEIVKVDIRQNPKLAKEYNIEFTPTMMIFEKGEVIGKRKVGAASIDRLENYIDRTAKVGQERKDSF
ncbi:MAG: thioredoxin fold domain-containing protein [Spirosoma sp.]|nr:thioredoxin fold domain-containing protein [Spirosoma sp.]